MNYRKKAMLMAGALLCLNLSIYSQSISLKMSNVSVKKAMTELQTKSGYSFVYITGDVDTDRTVSINASQLKDAVAQILKGQNVSYEIQGKNIVIKKGNQQQVTSGKRKKVTGTVKDANGEPIIGATVVEKGTTNGTVTDFDGNYTLELSESGTLAVSYIGYKSQEYSVAKIKQGQLSVVLKEDAEVMDEVVVVGYGTQKKSNVTGSVASIKTSDFNDLNLDVTSVLQGRVAGVDVSNGSIIIRGAASINGSDPLWIVDGVPGSAPNMNDIESLEILKDAASTAIYGARGAGGVILVTTKKGKPGKVSVNVKMNVGVGLPIDIPDMLRTSDYIDRKLAAGFSQSTDSGWENPFSLPDTNWKDYVWQNALKQNYFAQVTGGNEKTSFNASVEYTRNERVQKGALDNSGNLRFSSQTKFNKRFKMTETVTLGFSNNTPSVYGDGSKIWYRQVPTMTPYDKENTAGGGWGMQPAGGYYEGPNPLALIDGVHQNNRSYKGGANLIFDWEIIDGLTATANFSGNFSSYANNKFQEYTNVGNFSQEQRYTKDYGESYDLRMLYTLTYGHTFADKHNLKGLLGYEAYKSESSSAGGWRTGFSVEPVDDMSLGSGSTEALGGKGLSRSLSQFARINYAYDDKYMVEASIRRDGYDNFGPENRFGIFPSASAGWNIMRESFMQDNENLDWIDALKLRGSVGRIGNNTVQQFLYEAPYTSNYLYYSYDNNTVNRGFWYHRIPNAAIKWEDVLQWNIGLDASFWGNRLNTTIEYYSKKTSDMLYSIGAPSSSGAYSSDIFAQNPSYMANIGEISNKGIEFMIRWRDSYQNFKYDVAFTMSTNRNKVLKLSDQINPVIWRGTSTALNSSIYRTENNHPMGMMYGYIVDGIIQNQDEINALNAQAPDGIYQYEGTTAGDFKYRDITGDGKITEDDKTFIGNPWPKFTYGLNINMSWKGFDLAMGWTANSNVDIFNSSKIYERSFYGDFNTTYKVYDAWSETNRNTVHPRVTTSDPNNNFRNVSSYFVEDGSFLKLKNLHFGYNLPQSLLSRFNIKGIKLYINCDNLLIISKFQGDPEIGGGYLNRNHYVETRFPETRSIMGGISLTF